MKKKNVAKKRLVTICVAVVMFLSAICGTSIALVNLLPKSSVSQQEEGKKDWGTFQTSHLKGSGTEYDPWKISNADQLAFMANSLNELKQAQAYDHACIAQALSGTSVEEVVAMKASTVAAASTTDETEEVEETEEEQNYFELSNDIDLSSYAWQPIPEVCGVFEGNNHTINIGSRVFTEENTNSSAFYNSDGAKCIALFQGGEMASSNIVVEGSMDITLQEPEPEAQSEISANASIKGNYVNSHPGDWSGGPTGANEYLIGGVYSYNGYSIANVISSVSIEITTKFNRDDDRYCLAIGGVTGKNCRTLVGFCVFTGSIWLHGGDDNNTCNTAVGGIVGWDDGGIIYDSHNYGRIECGREDYSNTNANYREIEGSIYVGGICGVFSRYNQESIARTGEDGLISRKTDNEKTYNFRNACWAIFRCANFGYIFTNINAWVWGDIDDRVAPSAVGGIVGCFGIVYLPWNQNDTYDSVNREMVAYCVNAGRINNWGKKTDVGGICGYSDTNQLIKDNQARDDGWGGFLDVINYGEIYSQNGRYVGSIIGSWDRAGWMDGVGFYNWWNHIGYYGVCRYYTTLSLTPIGLSDELWNNAFAIPTDIAAGKAYSETFYPWDDSVSGKPFSDTYSGEMKWNSLGDINPNPFMAVKRSTLKTILFAKESVGKGSTGAAEYKTQCPSSITDYGSQNYDYDFYFPYSVFTAVGLKYVLKKDNGSIVTQPDENAAITYARGDDIRIENVLDWEDDPELSKFLYVNDKNGNESKIYNQDVYKLDKKGYTDRLCYIFVRGLKYSGDNLSFNTSAQVTADKKEFVFRLGENYYTLKNNDKSKWGLSATGMNFNNFSHSEDKIHFDSMLFVPDFNIGYCRAATDSKPYGRISYTIPTITITCPVEEYSTKKDITPNFYITNSSNDQNAAATNSVKAKKLDFKETQNMVNNSLDQYFDTAEINGQNLLKSDEKVYLGQQRYSVTVPNAIKNFEVRDTDIVLTLTPKFGYAISFASYEVEGPIGGSYMIKDFFFNGYNGNCFSRESNNWGWCEEEMKKNIGTNNYNYHLGTVQIHLQVPDLKTHDSTNFNIMEQILEDIQNIHIGIIPLQYKVTIQNPNNNDKVSPYLSKGGQGINLLSKLVGQKPNGLNAGKNGWIVTPIVSKLQDKEMDKKFENLSFDVYNQISSSLGNYSIIKYEDVINDTYAEVIGIDTDEFIIKFKEEPLQFGIGLGAHIDTDSNNSTEWNDGAGSAVNWNSNIKINHGSKESWLEKTKLTADVESAFTKDGKLMFDLDSGPEFKFNSGKIGEDYLLGYYYDGTYYNFVFYNSSDAKYYPGSALSNKFTTKQKMVDALYANFATSTDFISKILNNSLSSENYLMLYFTSNYELQTYNLSVTDQSGASAVTLYTYENNNKVKGTLESAVKFYTPISLEAGKVSGKQFLGWYLQNGTNELLLSTNDTYNFVYNADEAAIKDKLAYFDRSNSGLKVKIVAKFAEAANLSGEAITPTMGVYHVKKEEHLLWLAKEVAGGKSFEGKLIVLDNDINLTNFTPIGTEASPFKGVFDGKFNHIYGLKVDDNLLVGSGLFGFTDDAVIKNLVIVSPQVKGYNQVGAVAGNAKNTTFSRVEIYNASDSTSVISAEGIRFYNIYGLGKSAKYDTFVTRDGKIAVEEEKPYRAQINPDNAFDARDAFGGFVGMADGCSFVGCSLRSDDFVAYTYEDAAEEVKTQQLLPTTFGGIVGLTTGTQTTIDQCYFEHMGSLIELVAGKTARTDETYEITNSYTYAGKDSNYYEADTSVSGVWFELNSRKVLKIFYW